MTALDYYDKLQKIIERPGDFDLPASASIIACFLKNYTPGDSDTYNLSMTSTEIVNCLEDIAQLNITDVATVMAALGYDLIVDRYGELTWAMIRPAIDDIPD